MANEMNSLFTLIGQAVFERMARGGVDQGGQNWQPPMPYPSRDGATTPWEQEIQKYMSSGSEGPKPWSYGPPDSWDQGHMRWGYRDGDGGVQPYGKYAGSYGGPDDPTYYREWVYDGPGELNGRIVGGRVKR